MTLSVVVVTHSRLDLLGPCLESVLAAGSELDAVPELIVVDSGSEQPVAKVVEAHAPEARILPLQENVGFPAAVQHGIEASSGTWVLTLNDDLTLEPQAIRELLSVAKSEPKVAAVAAQMRFTAAPEVINSAGIEVDRLAISTDRMLGAPADNPDLEPYEVFGACAGAALYLREALTAIGGFDRRFFAFLDDVDVAWRLRMQGWRCLYAPAAVVLHHHSATLVNRSWTQYYWGGRNRVRMLAKNADGRLLRRYGLAMIAYDVAYVAYAAVMDRTLAPLRGRLAGVREWRSYRKAGADARRPLVLAPVGGVRRALRRRSVWTEKSSAAASRRPAAP